VRSNRLHLPPNPPPASFLGGIGYDFAKHGRNADIAFARFALEKLPTGIVKTQGNW